MQFDSKERERTKLNFVESAGSQHSSSDVNYSKLFASACFPHFVSINRFPPSYEREFYSSSLAVTSLNLSWTSCGSPEAMISPFERRLLFLVVRGGRRVLRTEYMWNVCIVRLSKKAIAPRGYVTRGNDASMFGNMQQQRTVGCEPVVVCQR